MLLVLPVSWSWGKSGVLNQALHADQPAVSDKLSVHCAASPPHPHTHPHTDHDHEHEHDRYIIMSVFGFAFDIIEALFINT